MADGAFQLGLLPERKIDRRALFSSYTLVILFLFFLVNVGVIWPDRLQLVQTYHVTELIPLPSLQPEPVEAPPPPPVVHAKLLPPVVLETPKLIVPRDVRPLRTPAVELQPPKVALNTFAPPVLKDIPGGARPAQIVHAGEFGSSAAPTVNAPVQRVQTGGFGDPNGIPGEGKGNSHLVMAKTGSFDLPSGPGVGNGAGGSAGMKGTIASTGFGNGIASAGNGDARSGGRGSVQTSGFGDQQIAQAGKPHALDAGPATTPVEIIFKPSPVYTEEARQLKLEGEVLLEVMFTANGQLHVNRVVRGLGHGLDEAGVAAAAKMRFKPAMRNGQAVDSTATVHVVFQLAY